VRYEHYLEIFICIYLFISRCCGAKWKRMSLRERQPYMEESERLKQLHARQYPTYKVRFCFLNIKILFEITIF
jgi:hypothetical protein